jgi:spermidine/putrescine-binding protein
MKILKCFLFFSLLISSNVEADHSEQKTIKILAWADYFEPAVLKAFEK